MFNLIKHPDTKSQCISETVGQRRKLIKNWLNLEAIQYTTEKLISKPDKTTCYSSEYKQNFCNSTLSPSINSEEIQQKNIKYPLYGGSIQTVYHQLVMDGALKNRDAIININEPFRRNSIMSLSPEDKLY